MISYINGILQYANEEYVIVENNGIGYQIFTSTSIINKLPCIGYKVKIFTYLHVREDLLALFGFIDYEELKLFKKLILVNGIGPKGALGILSILTPNDIILAVTAEDIKTLCKAPGIGKKTAQRLILDLKDKIKLKDTIMQYNKQSKINNDIIEEAILALESLGYSRSKALRAVSKIEHYDNVQTIIKKALKLLS